MSEEKQLTDRLKLILKVSIEEHVNSGEAIASIHLDQHPQIKWSAPLIRIELRELENLGYLKQHDASRGRVPTTQGYKYYTSYLLRDEQEVLSDELKEKFLSLLDDRNKTNTEIIGKACEIISEATNMLTITTEVGEAKEITLEDILSYKLGDNRVNILFVYSNGKVKHQIHTLENKVKEQDLITAVKIFSERLSGTSVSELKEKSASLKEIVIKQISMLEDNFQKLVSKLFDNIELKYLNKGSFNIVKVGNLEKDKENLMNLMKLVENNSIWEMIDKQKEQIKSSTNISVNAVPNLENISVIDSELQINGSDHKIALIGSSRTNYKHIFSILSWLMNKLKEQETPEEITNEKGGDV